MAVKHFPFNTLRSGLHLLKSVVNFLPLLKRFVSICLLVQLAAKCETIKKYLYDKLAHFKSNEVDEN